MEKMQSVKASFHSMELSEQAEVLLFAAENIAYNLIEPLRLSGF